jgi:hypothetical protein
MNGVMVAMSSFALDTMTGTPTNVARAADLRQAVVPIHSGSFA